MHIARYKQRVAVKFDTSAILLLVCCLARIGFVLKCIIIRVLSGSRGVRTCFEVLDIHVNKYHVFPSFELTLIFDFLHRLTACVKSRKCT